jgi:hypothetical protein
LEKARDKELLFAVVEKSDAVNRRQKLAVGSPRAVRLLGE